VYEGPFYQQKCMRLVQHLEKELQEAQATTKTDVGLGVRGHAFLQINKVGVWGFQVKIQNLKH